MPSVVKQLFQSADLGLCQIIVPAIVAFEIGYLSEKGRIDTSLSQLRQHIAQYPAYLEHSLSFEVIEAAFQISDVPELHDRLIAGTARLADTILITNDPVIQASTFTKTIW